MAAHRNYAGNGLPAARRAQFAKSRLLGQAAIVVGAACRRATVRQVPGGPNGVIQSFHELDHVVRLRRVKQQDPGAAGLEFVVRTKRKLVGLPSRDLDDLRQELNDVLRFAVGRIAVGAERHDDAMMPNQSAGAANRQCAGRCSWQLVRLRCPSQSPPWLLSAWVSVDLLHGTAAAVAHRHRPGNAGRQDDDFERRRTAMPRQYP